MTKTRILFLMAFSLGVSGCSSGGDDGAGITDPVIPLEDTGITDSATTEIVTSTETVESTAIPVAQVSTVEMDEFVENPLAKVIPAELRDHSHSQSSAQYVSNPLIY